MRHIHQCDVCGGPFTWVTEEGESYPLLWSYIFDPDTICCSEECVIAALSEHD